MKPTTSLLLRLLHDAEKRIAELEARNRRLLRLSHTDELTGYVNRRAILERLQTEIARGVRYHSPLSIALLDLDHFKEINDRYGHLAGDAVLQAVASLFRRCQRDTDLVGRYGGEEFLVVLPNTDRHGAELFCLRLRDQLQKHPVRFGPQTLHVTASFGVAELGVGVATAEDLLEHADRNLYAAKAQGRNRVVA